MNLRCQDLFVWVHSCSISASPTHVCSVFEINCNTRVSSQVVIVNILFLVDFITTSEVVPLSESYSVS